MTLPAGWPGKRIGYQHRVFVKEGNGAREHAESGRVFAAAEIGHQHHQCVEMQRRCASQRSCGICPRQNATRRVALKADQHHHHFVARALHDAPVQIDRIGQCDPWLGAGDGHLQRRLQACAQLIEGGLQDRHLTSRQCRSQLKKLVLPDRIELSTSPLPMECSTTELRQRALKTRIGPKGPSRAGRSLPQGPRPRKRAGPAGSLSKAAQNRPELSSSETGSRKIARFNRNGKDARRRLQSDQFRADPVPHLVPQRLQRLDRPDHHLEFGHFA